MNPNTDTTTLADRLHWWTTRPLYIRAPPFIAAIIAVNVLLNSGPLIALAVAVILTTFILTSTSR